MKQWLLPLAVAGTIVVINVVHIEQFRAEYEARWMEEYCRQLQEFGRPFRDFANNSSPEQFYKLLPQLDRFNSRFGTIWSMLKTATFRKERLDYLFGYDLWIAIAITTIFAWGLTRAMGWWIQRTSDIPKLVACLGFVLFTCVWMAVSQQNIWTGSRLSIIREFVVLFGCPLLFAFLAGRNSRTKSILAGIQTCAVAGALCLLLLYGEIVMEFWDSHLTLLFGKGCLMISDPYRLDSWLLWAFGGVSILVCILGALGGGLAIVERKLRRTTS